MEIATTLLEYGANTNATTRQGITPLHLASQEGNVDIVTLLLAKDATISLGNKSGLTPLHLAAQDDKVNVAEVLVNQGATVDPETKMGYTPLHVACHYGNVKMVNFLLKNQAKINAKTKNGYTPLHQAAQQGHTHIINLLLQHGASPNHVTVNGNTALSIARRLGYISVVDTLKVVTEETQTTLTVTEKHKMNVPETMNEVLDMSDDDGEDAMTGDTDKYLGPQDLRELGDDSLPQEGYMGFSIGARSASLRSFSSDRSNTLNRTSYTRDSVMIEEILAPTKDMNLVVASRDCNSDSLRHYSWTADTLDNINMVSSPIHSGLSSPLPQYDSRFLVSFMVDARGGSMRGSRHNGMRIIIPPRKCTAPTRITCRLAKRHKLATPPPMVDGEGLASRLVEVGPAGAQFLGPVIVEIPHFGSMRGKERELIMLRSENGETWKEHQYDCKTDDLNELLNGMDEELDSAKDLEKKRICRIITKDFPQYFAVVSRIRQESSQMGPEGGVLSSLTLPLVQASFPEGALTKKIRVGLQAQPAPDDMVQKILGNRATFSPIVTVEPRRRKFHKPITMTIPVPPLSGEGVSNGYKGDSTPCLRLLCSITGGTSPAQWEDITGTTPLTFVNDCVSFTTNVSARFWLADCHQIPETVGLATQLYRELICVPYMAKFVVFAKMNDPMESRLRCFCMTDDKVDKTLEQQENFEEVARSKDIEVLEGRPIYVDCYGNLAPLAKAGQLLVLNFYAFKENRLPFCVKVRDNSQEPCGRLTFLKETTKTAKGFPQTAVCNLNITLPALKKEMESDPDEETEKPERRHTFTSLALRKRYSYLAEPATKTVERSAARTLPAGYTHKPVFSTRSYKAWSAAPLPHTVQARCGLGSLSGSRSNTLPAAPLKSAWLLSSASPIKSTLGASPSHSVKSSGDIASIPVRSYRTMASPIKTVIQQAQYPVQVSASLVSSSSKPGADPVFIKGLSTPFSSRTTPASNTGSVPDRSIMTQPESPKCTANMYTSSLPFKSVLSSSSSSPVRTIAGLSSLSSSPVRTNAGLSSSSSSPVRTIAGLSSSSSSPVRTIAGLSSSSSSPVRTIAGLSSSSSSPVRTIAGLSSSSSSPVRTIAGLSSSSSSPVRTIPGLSTTSAPSKGKPLPSLSSPAHSSEASAMVNGLVSPMKYTSSSQSSSPSPSSPCSCLLSDRSSSLQERIQTTTHAATSSVSAAINEAERTFNSSGYGTLKSASSRRSNTSTSVYGSMRSQTSSTTSATSNTMTVPVYSFLNVTTESQMKKGPGSLKMSSADSRRSKTAVKSPPYITPPGLTLTPPSSLSSNQDILKDVADMKEDLIRMTAILQTDPRTARNVQSQTPKEPKMEDEEPFTIVEKVKEDLVKVSEILTKDVVSDSQACRGKPSEEEEWEEFSKDELEEAQQSAKEFFHPPFDANTLSFRPQSMPSKELNLAKVVDYLANDIGASSLSKMAEMKSRYEEAKREGEDKQKLKKLKMPPSGMRTSASEKDLCKLAESYYGPDAILESPEDLSHEQDKSPLSDSGFETRSEKTPSAPQSAESTGPKPPFTDPIPPCITETRTEVVHIRSYEHPDEPCEVQMEEAASASPACIEPEASSSASSSIKDKVKSFQIKVSDDSDSVVSKSMRLKEETHITTTTRMVYHKPQLKDGSERIEETMSVRDIMKAFQSGRDPSKELAGLFEHKAGQDSVKGDELTPRFIDNDTKAKRIMEVHIEKEGNTFQPTEVIIRETKKIPDSYFYKGDHRIQELPDYDEAQQEGEELTANDSRPSSTQLMADDSYKALKLLSQHSVEYHNDELSELRGESYRFAEKMLRSEKLDISHSDTEDSMADQTHQITSESHGAESDYGEKEAVPRKELTFKSSKDTSSKSGKCSHKDDKFDKVTVLHYTTEPGSPKHAVWMCFTEDKLDRNREKLIYEDRVDQTVKEAEEKLSEVSQFFRDKTEKLNDELQSPEKKPPKRDPRETRSGSSSTCNSPEKTQQKAKAEGEEWGKGRGNKLFSSTTERKTSSLPNSPERAVLSLFSEDTSKQQTKVEECSAPTQVKASFSRVSSVRMKFESEAQNQDKSSPQAVQSTPPVSRLQENKLPVNQLFTGGKTTKGSEATEEGSPFKKIPEKLKGPASNSSKSVVSSAAPKQSGDKLTNKNLPYTTAQKHLTGQTDKESEKTSPLSQESQGIGISKGVKGPPSHSPTHDAPKENSGEVEKEQVSMRDSPSKHVASSPTTNRVAHSEPVSKDHGEAQNKNLRKKTESQIPDRSVSSHSDSDQSEKAKQDTVTKPSEKTSQIPILNKNRIRVSPVTSPTKTDELTDTSLEILDNAPKDSNLNNVHDTCTREIQERLAPEKTTTRENFKGIKTLPVYVSVQVGRQGEREGRGGVLYKQKQPSSPQASPDDDTLEQVSFIDSSGKSPLTPETPSSEEISYDLTSRTPDSILDTRLHPPFQPSPIPEVSEDSSEEEQGQVFSFKDFKPETPNVTAADLKNGNHQAGQTPKDKGVAYIQFPPPPPLDSEQSGPEKKKKKGSCGSSEAEMEMMEVNLQEEHDKRLLTEPIIRVQPPSPVPPGADDSDSSDDESVFQPISFKKYTFKISEGQEQEIKNGSKSPKQDKNRNNKEPGTNKTNGTYEAGKTEEYDSEQNGNDQSITDCSIATTAEFSHDTDATEVDSLDGYDMQDEDDGLCEIDTKPFSLPDSRKDVWTSDSMLRSCDRSFSQTKLEAIEEEKTPEEEFKKAQAKSDPVDIKTDGAISQDQKDNDGFSDTYFSYKLEEAFDSPFKTVATKGLDFDPWSTIGGDNEMVDARIKDDEPKPFGLAADDRSQATTPDTTPARTPTDDSTTPTSEPNPFPFHEGKMFEMTRSGAIDMSKRDIVEERLQFFQIGPQSPCERTDLRMAIVADHLGLSWTELAREMDFSVDEINHIRVDNPNSLTAQSFMLLKKWVSRDGKNTTTDSLTEVLTKINRMDIVTLLEGPIFDYGNISGTRCFADDNAVTLDQCNGSSSIQLELQTPTGLICQPPTPLSSDHFFDEDAGLDSPSRTPTRPCDLSLTQTTSTPGPASHAQPPTMVVEEDTSGPLDSQGPGEGPEEGPKVTSTENDTGVSRESVASYKPHDREAGVREEADQDVDMGMLIRQIDLPQGVVREDEWLAGARGDPSETLGFRPALGGGSGSPGEEEEEGEMSEEKLKSLLEEMALEEGSEDEDMTEDRINAILSQVQQADKDVMSSPAGWHSETSGVNVEPPTPGRSLSAEGNDLQDTSPVNSLDSLTTSPVRPAEKSNGDHADFLSQTGSHPEAQASSNGVKGHGQVEDEGRASASQGGQEEEGGVQRSQHKVQGEEARNIPVESVTEEQFTDEDGNIVSRKSGEGSGSKVKKKQVEKDQW
ncbi:ankyrin-3 isoform X7 [Salmo salar]|uniref:Ankyrin-3 isoform X7 n=2 Tax=Salmo salar TaxID=8030 RepID=A0ABM3C9T7_SALSA|nr:ankyrin-3-like isoform X7 [Salmo salar]